MFVVVFVSLLALLLTYLEQKKVVHNGMKIGFILATFLGCIHYDYGSDYMGYYYIYNDVVKYPFYIDVVFSGERFKEVGWALICYFFESIGGFFMLVAVFNNVQNILIYKTLRRYVQRKLLPFSVFIYFFTTNLYLLNFSMMRQGFVVCVFFGIWHLIIQRKVLPSLLILYLCAHIHTSAYILLPFAFWGYISVVKSKILAFSFLICFLLLWVGKGFMADFLNAFMTVDKFSAYAEVYSNSDSHVTYGLGYMLKQIPFILSILYLFKKDILPEHKAVVALGIIFYIIIPFGSLIPLIGRIAIYFEAYQMLSFPIIYFSINRKSIFWAVFGLYLFVTIYEYIYFFNNPIWIDKYTTFKTIFTPLFNL